MRLDPAVLAALDLHPSVSARIAPLGGSSFSSTAKISTSDGDSYFLKTGSGEEAKAMFAGEFTSLEHMSRANPAITARPISHGELLETPPPGRYYLLTEFLDLSDRRRSGTLAKELAALHLARPHPSAEGRGFGFPLSTCCGSTPQDNTWTSSWPEFFSRRRLRPVLEACERSNVADGELRELVAATAAKVVPRLLGALGEVRPSLVHGDLWSGNAAGAKVYDPSCCYAHSEYEIGIMELFGGFRGEFWEEYHRSVPKAQPESEFEDRVQLYALYHQLNHLALFGGGFRSGAVSIMQKLIRKYGGD
ncbi:Fructosamine/Ketosamine-3-kinase [Sphaerosporella brunnea]|uniref:protein-ribulosamine 3-kinase n=1 Tax=Sphaerosporella brunnea TaxID=1250544 RepID=A0A5J5EHW1_9PEZI|nr:Fructosamine/Ketosamine-3-kinase [Sphaerosporella brunnea]